MDDENILRAADIGQIFDAVANGFLSCTAAGNDPLQLVNTKLLGVCPQYLVPAVKANDPQWRRSGDYAESLPMYR